MITICFAIALSILHKNTNVNLKDFPVYLLLATGVSDLALLDAMMKMFTAILACK